MPSSDCKHSQLITSIAELSVSGDVQLCGGTELQGFANGNIQSQYVPLC